MASGTISKRTVDSAEKGPKDWFLWDDDLSGFGLKVTPAGGKVYVFQYRLARPGEAEKTPAKRYTIGKHGKLTPEQARKRAKELAALVSQGVDPRQRELDAIVASDEADLAAAERARLDGELAFENIADVWLDHYENEKDRRPSSVRQAKLIVNGHLKPRLRGKPLPHITRSDLQPIIDALPAKQRGMRRAVFAYASVLFGWAHKRGDIAENPLTGMVKPEPPKPRDRVLDDDELVAIWNAAAASNAPFGSFFRLLILTGQRRSEVAAINWAELDRTSTMWAIPAGRAKNGVAHLVPLTTTAVDELDALALEAQVKAEEKDPDKTRWPRSGYVLTTTGRSPISGITKAKDALDTFIKEARDGTPLPGWRIHDLRRTLATGFQRLGVRFEVTEAVLNHVSGAKSGVAGIYQRHNWATEKRHALDAWDAFVANLLKPKKGDRKVVPLRKHGRA
jgi:integrase